MARHSNGKNTFAMAGWVLTLLAALILAIAVGLYFLLRGGGSPDATTATDSEVAETTAVDASGTQEANAETSAAASRSKEVPSSTSKADKSNASSTSAAPDNKAGATFADNTLVLLDTSDGLAPYFNPVTQALAETATALGEKNGLVSLWNYSSPISETATVGYRQNIGFGEAGPVAFAVQQFGTGGVPQTRSAVTAALTNASEQAAGTGKNAKVLLVTTGTAQDMDDSTFKQVLKEAESKDVTLSVVHVGDGDKDPVLDDAADPFTAVTDPSDEAAVAKALKAAAGA
ncbi:TPA: VWA domain-containing protein [Corynebacterium striatum]|nr:VWA domain-containing protein [Corynebacterium striatum]